MHGDRQTDKNRKNSEETNALVTNVRRVRFVWRILCVLCNAKGRGDDTPLYRPITTTPFLFLLSHEASSSAEIQVQTRPRDRVFFGQIVGLGTRGFGRPQKTQAGRLWRGNGQSQNANHIGRGKECGANGRYRIGLRLFLGGGDGKSGDILRGCSALVRDQAGRKSGGMLIHDSWAGFTVPRGRVTLWSGR